MENLFKTYLKLKNNSISEKTIRHYSYALSGRITDFAKAIFPDYETVFKMNHNDAKKLFSELKRNDTFISKSKKSNNVHLTAINHYSKFIDYYSEIISANTTNNTIINKKDTITEGNSYKCHSTEYRRNKKLRDTVAYERDYICEICGIKFNNIYGSIGCNFIEVHHKQPLNDGPRNTQKDDLICVCSNCHSMLHRKNPPISPDELKLIIKIANHQQ